MRTTVSIDREAHRRLLALAERHGWNVGQAVEYALFDLSELTEAEARSLEYAAESRRLRDRLAGVGEGRR